MCSNRQTFLSWALLTSWLTCCDVWWPEFEAWEVNNGLFKLSSDLHTYMHINTKYINAHLRNLGKILVYWALAHFSLIEVKCLFSLHTVSVTLALNVSHLPLWWCCVVSTCPLCVLPPLKQCFWGLVVISIYYCNHTETFSKHWIVFNAFSSLEVPGRFEEWGSQSPVMTVFKHSLPSPHLRPDSETSNWEHSFLCVFLRFS